MEVQWSCTPGLETLGRSLLPTPVSLSFVICKVGWQEYEGGGSPVCMRTTISMHCIYLLQLQAFVYLHISLASLPRVLAFEGRALTDGVPGSCNAVSRSP